jgi:hypothetical protein
MDPPRIGLNFDRGREDDFCWGDIGPPSTWRERRWAEGDIEYYDDEWGNVWHRVVGMSTGGEVWKPALADWSMLRDYQLPDLADPQRYEGARRLFAQDREHYRAASLPGFPFAICRYLRKMEVYLQDLVLERACIDELHDRVTTLLERVIEQFAWAGADGIFFCEDWGTQERLLVSPTMWREIYKPLYLRLCGRAHRLGLHVIMHSCGYNWAILDDLAEVGVNCFQFDQPELYGLENLAHKLRDLKVCLFAPVDIQRTMPTGDHDRITSTARRMVSLFGGVHGGFVAKNYPDLNGIGVRSDWDDWAYHAFLDAGVA